MKSSKQCPKCDSLKVGHLPTVPDEADDYGVLASTIGMIEKVSGKWLKVFRSQKVGMLEAFVCTECGYYETYVKQPQEVRFGAIAGFSWVNPRAAAQGPFRG